MSKKIQQLQLLQQNLSQLAEQKQHMQSIISDYASALEEITQSDTSYKIVGKLMIKTASQKLIQELEEKKKMATLRLEKVTDQEQRLQKQTELIQKEVMEDLKSNGKQ